MPLEKFPGTGIYPEGNPVSPNCFAFSKRGAKILFDWASFYRSPYHENMSHLPLHCDSFEVDSPHVSYR